MAVLTKPLTTAAKNPIRTAALNSPTVRKAAGISKPKPTLSKPVGVTKPGTKPVPTVKPGAGTRPPVGQMPNKQGGPLVPQFSRLRKNARGMSSRLGGKRSAIEERRR